MLTYLLRIIIVVVPLLFVHAHAQEDEHRVYWQGVQDGLHDNETRFARVNGGWLVYVRSIVFRSPSGPGSDVNSQTCVTDINNQIYCAAGVGIGTGLTFIPDPNHESPPFLQN